MNSGETPAKKNWWWWAVVAAGALVPWIVLAFQVRRYGVNLPFSDQWEFVLLVQELRADELGIRDFFKQHNEQRMFFPRLIMMGLAVLTDWNVKAEMAVNLLLGMAIFGITFVLLVRTLGFLRRWVAVPVVVASALLSSFVQWENWFWGWQISWFLPLFCLFAAVGVLTLWPRDRPAWPAIGLAAAAAFVGQYSLLSGSMIWVVCVPLLFVRKSFRMYLIPWLSAAAVATFVYLRNYRTVAGMEYMRAGVDQLIEEPGTAVGYVMYLLGRPLLNAEPQVGAGVALTVIFAVAAAYLLLFKRDQRMDALPWLALGAYAAGAAVATMLGRLNLGVHQAGSSRYTTLGIVLTICTLALVSLAVLPRAKLAALSAALPGNTSRAPNLANVSGHGT
ncbi:MAG: hypothetical protein WD602_05560, partial [Actinomycetota bacterium]